jgi:hypothetical protein
VLDPVIEWLSALKGERTTPDRWSLYTGARDLMDLAEAERGEDKFSRAERDVIRDQVEAVKVAIRSLPGRTEEQVASANAKLDYLVAQGRNSLVAIGVSLRWE